MVFREIWRIRYLTASTQPIPGLAPINIRSSWKVIALFLGYRAIQLCVNWTLSLISWGSRGSSAYLMVPKKDQVTMNLEYLRGQSMLRRMFTHDLWSSQIIRRIHLSSNAQQKWYQTFIKNIADKSKSISCFFSLYSSQHAAADY